MLATLDVLDDRLALRAVLASCGLSATPYAHVAAAAQVRAALGRIGYPAVLRSAAPVRGWEPYMVSGPQHVPGWAALLARRGHNGPVLIEPYLRGVTYTAALHSTDGEHQLLGLAEHELSLPPLFITMGHLYPASAPPARAAAITELAGALLTACGHRDGPVNVTVVWTEAGPDVVRVRRAPATGDDLDRLAARSVTTGAVAARSHFWLPCGEITTVDGLAEIRALDFVDELVFPFRTGDRIGETLDAESRHGYVTLTAATAEQARERVAAVRGMLQVSVRPRPALAAIPRPRAGR